MADDSNKAKLVGCVGAGCAIVLLTVVPQFENTVYTTYVDPVGIVTACAGHTGAELKLGQKFTKEQCQAMLEADLLKHAEPVLKCTPGLQGQTYRLAAAVSFAFNVGTTAYCTSNVAKAFNRRDYVAGCAALSQWVHAGGKVLPGLVKRRKIERDMCEGKLEVPNV